MSYTTDPSNLLHVIQPLRGGPMRQSAYLEATKDISLGDLTAALELRLLRSVHPPAGPEPVIVLLPAGNDLLRSTRIAGEPGPDVRPDQAGGVSALRP